MKGKDTRGYPYRGCLPAAGCNWLRVHFDEAETSEDREKNPQSQIETDWNSALIQPKDRIEPRPQRWEAQLITAKPPWVPLN